MKMLETWDVTVSNSLYWFIRERHMIEFARPLLVARKRWAILFLIYAFVLIMAMGFSKEASAYGTQTGTVTSIYVNESLGSLAYITMTGTKSSGPSCSSGSTWAYVLSLTNGDAPQLFSMLLTARTTGATITLTGDGACDLVSDVETLWVVSY